MSEVPKPKALFMAEQRVIGRCGQAALQAIDPEEITRIGRARLPRKFDKYERLGMHFYEAFNKVARAASYTNDFEDALRKYYTDSPEIKHGYVTAGRLVGHGVQAYRWFCNTGKKQPAATELQDLLLAPPTFETLVTDLAAMPDDANDVHEEHLFLRRAGYKAHRKTPTEAPAFRVKADTSDTLSIAPDPDLAAQAEQRCPVDHQSTSRPYDKCVALRVLLPDLWQQMVTIAAEHPNYFQADLA